MGISARDLTPLADDALVLATRLARAIKQRREKEKQMGKLSEEQKDLLGAVAWGRALADRDLEPLKLAYLEGLSVKTAAGASAWLQKLEGLGFEKRAGVWDWLKGLFSPPIDYPGRSNASAGDNPLHPGAAVDRAREERIQQRENPPPRDPNASANIAPTQTLYTFDPDRPGGVHPTYTSEWGPLMLTGSTKASPRSGQPLINPRTGWPTVFRPDVGESAIPDAATGTWQTDPLYSGNRQPMPSRAPSGPGPIQITEGQETRRAPATDVSVLRGAGLPTDPAARAAAVEGLTPKTSASKIGEDPIETLTQTSLPQGVFERLQQSIPHRSLEDAANASLPHDTTNVYVPPTVEEDAAQQSLPRASTGDLNVLMSVMDAGIADAKAQHYQRENDAQQSLPTPGGGTWPPQIPDTKTSASKTGGIGFLRGAEPSTQQVSSSLSSAFLEYASELPAEKRAAFLEIASAVSEDMTRATIKVLGALRGQGKTAASLEDVQSFVADHPRLPLALGGAAVGTGIGALAGRGKDQKTRTQRKLMGLFGGTVLGGLGGDVAQMIRDSR